mgnify:CR=1 FL=1|jgi:5-methylcytosine-specific restriction endonuclease McrA
MIILSWIITFIVLLFMWSRGENPFEYHRKNKLKEEQLSRRYDFIAQMRVKNEVSYTKTIIKQNRETDYSWAKRIFLASDDWKSIKNIVFDKYPKKCMRCGATSSIEVDHINSVYRNPDLRLSEDNLQVLCRGCNTNKGTDFADYRTKHGRELAEAEFRLKVGKRLVYAARRSPRDEYIVTLAKQYASSDISGKENIITELRARRSRYIS